jgi:hypothetical protein
MHTMRFFLGLFQLMLIFLFARAIGGMFSAGRKNRSGRPGASRTTPVERFNAKGKNIADADYEDVK